MKSTREDEICPDEIGQRSWLKENAPQLEGKNIIYISPEIKIGWGGSLMSGGLGVLAGELVKGLAQIGANVYAVSLLYKKVFVQKIEQGGQVIEQIDLDYASLPIKDTGQEVDIHVWTEIREIEGKKNRTKIKKKAKIWQVKLDNAVVYLLECPEITDVLYTGDRKQRLRQEVLLGRGALELLEKLNIRPDIIHMNEAHSAVAAIARVADPGFADNPFFDDTEFVFTTHTPIEGALERYPIDWLDELGIDKRFSFLLERKGQMDFTAAAFNICFISNAVSEEHKEVMRKLYPEFKNKIIGIANGVDIDYWQMSQLKEQEISEGEIRQVKQEAKQRLIDEVEKRTGIKLSLDRPTLVIARRLTAYKNHAMILERIRDICQERSEEGLGAQVIIAGKAHSDDLQSTDLIREFVRLTHEPEFRGKLVFVPNYDLDFARKAVQGAEIWISCPWEGYEACATSYAKALINGTVVISTFTGGAIEHMTEFNLETCEGNGFFIRPYNGGVLFEKIRLACQLYYDYKEGRDGRWLRLVENAYRSTPKVDIREVAKRYVKQVYLPALEDRRILWIGEMDPPLGSMVTKNLSGVLNVNAKIRVTNSVLPDDIEAEIFTNIDGNWAPVPMHLVGKQDDRYVFQGAIIPKEPGRFEYTVRFTIDNGRTRWWMSRPGENAYFTVNKP